MPACKMKVARMAFGVLMETKYFKILAHDGGWWREAKHQCKQVKLKWFMWFSKYIFTTSWGISSKPQK